MSFAIVDSDDRPIVVGAKVLIEYEAGDQLIGEVVVVGEPDGDWSDQLQRNIELCPRFDVRWPSGTIEHFGTYNDSRAPTWADYPYGVEHQIYRCDELEVVAPAAE